MMNNKTIVIAKEDLQVEQHTWTKGLDYELIERENHFRLCCNQGELSYSNDVKEKVLANFELAQPSVTPTKEIQFTIHLLEANKSELEGLLAQEDLLADVRERLVNEYNLTIGAIKQLTD